MRRMKRRNAAAALVLAVVAAGCMGNFEEPEVRLEGIRVGSVGLGGGLLYAELSVRNPNDFGLETRGLSYDLEVANAGEGDPDWVRLADGRYEDPIIVGAQDSTRFEVPVEFTFANLTGIVGAVLDRGVVDYRVSGTVDVREPRSLSVPFRRVGKVSLDAIR